MAEPLSKRFIQALEPARDRLYARALARAESPGAAESLLQRLVRQSFRASVDAAVESDPVVTLETELQASPAVAVAAPDAVMPADVWARLTAAVQIEAARSGAGAVLGSGRLINPESVLLLPDPLLAPKRPAAQDDAMDGLNLSPPSRFLVAAGIAIVLAILLTIFIVTRHSGTPPATAPATMRPTASAPATAHNP